MFVAGLKRVERLRGSGWVVCPHCGEHASQDVVDDMSFLSVGPLRLAPLRWHRSLVCRRCQFRRPNAPPTSLAIVLVSTLLVLGTAAGLVALASTSVVAVSSGSLAMGGLAAAAAAVVVGLRTCLERLGGSVPTGNDELARLQIGGTRIRRGLMLPFGITTIIAAIVLVGASIAAPPTVTAQTAVHFQSVSGTRTAPAVRFDVPIGWFPQDNFDSSRPYIHAVDSAQGDMSISLYRSPDERTIGDVVAHHFDDERGLSAEHFPVHPPATGRCTKVGGTAAYRLVIDYTQSSAPARVVLYAFVRDGVGYALEFTSTGSDQISTMNTLSDHVVTSLSFVGTEPSALPRPSPSAAPDYQC